MNPALFNRTLPRRFAPHKDENPFSGALLRVRVLGAEGDLEQVSISDDTYS